MAKWNSPSVVEGLEDENRRLTAALQQAEQERDEWKKSQATAVAAMAAAEAKLFRVEVALRALIAATREFVHSQAVLTGDPVRAKRAGDRLVELGVIGESEPR